ncbi:hypothetical protein, partial [Methyloglobulus sp.]|uniref:hypothetical protein n=1 Tax=Methyloglobulus sp. TaxID=2518622 RepID=UPI00398A013E
MTYRIKIRKNTSLLDIGNWASSEDGEVEFEITKASSFQLLAEGAALGKLRDLEIKLVPIRLEIYQSPITKDHEIDDTKLPPLFTTLFGLELIYLSKTVQVRNDSTQVNWRNSIGSHIWKQVLSNKGVISSGRIMYLVSRHGYEIPAVLRGQTPPAEFPRFDYFQQKIRPLISSLRDTAAGTSATEDHLIEWIFHIAENAFEHASETYEQGRLIPIRGYRGIVLQKIKFEMSKGVEHRNDLPDIVKNFITQRIEDCNIDQQGIINLATVVDLGVGIQNTVPRV